MQHGQEIRLVARPHGLPTSAEFALVDVDVREPTPGEVLVRNTFMSVDPYMRGRMSDAPSYVPPFELGRTLSGAAVGIVEASLDEHLPAGSTVLHSLGWRTHAVGPAGEFRAVDAFAAPASAYLGVLGMTGFTAYVGVALIGKVKAGDSVLISSAAGAVGTIAGQLAKRRGARVVGSTRSIESARVLRERLQFDETIVVEPGTFAEQLHAAAPDGIDFYFDNVGGEQLEAALGSLRDFGRVAVCGMIAGYNEPVRGPRNMSTIVQKRLRLQGFLVSDYAVHQAEFMVEVAPAVSAGEINGMETFVHGLANAPEAFVSLFAPGAHVGKLVVRLEA